METRRSQQRFHRLVVKLRLNVTDYMDSIQDSRISSLGLLETVGIDFFFFPHRVPQK